MNTQLTCLRETWRLGSTYIRTNQSVFVRKMLPLWVLSNCRLPQYLSSSIIPWIAPPAQQSRYQTRLLLLQSMALQLSLLRWCAIQMARNQSPLRHGQDFTDIPIIAYEYSRKNCITGTGIENNVSPCGDYCIVFILLNSRNGASHMLMFSSNTQRTALQLLILMQSSQRKSLKSFRCRFGPEFHAAQASPLTSLHLNTVSV